MNCQLLHLFAARLLGGSDVRPCCASAHAPIRVAVLLASCLALLLPAALASQQEPQLAPPPVTADTLSADTVDVFEETGPSPLGAFVRSLVLPGWGQAWVGAPGRGAVYFGLTSGSLWMVYRTGRRLDTARERQAFLRETGEIGEDETTSLVDSREQQREDWTALAIFLFLFSGADAYVSAQLADFGERIGVTPTIDGGLEIRFTAPLGGAP